METRILVATDGRPAAMGALRMARRLAERDNATVDVVAIVPPFHPLPSPVGDVGTLTTLELDRAATEALRAQVVDQLVELGPVAAAWPLTVESGPPAPSIVRLARDRDATIIVLGLGRHSVADRLFGTETALRVMRLAHVPVLAVPADAATLARRAVVAIDFSEYSREAARATVRLVGPETTVHLVHVVEPAPDGVRWSGSNAWAAAQRARAAEQLAELTRSLGHPDRIRWSPEVCEGEPASELLYFADRVKAELVAAGSHGAGFLGRLLMGSISTKLVRAATRMVLIAPPSTVPSELQDAWERDAARGPVAVAAAPEAEAMAT